MGRRCDYVEMWLREITLKKFKKYPFLFQWCICSRCGGAGLEALLFSTPSYKRTDFEKRKTSATDLRGTDYWHLQSTRFVTSYSDGYTLLGNTAEKYFPKILIVLSSRCSKCLQVVQNYNFSRIFLISGAWKRHTELYEARTANVRTLVLVSLPKIEKKQNVKYVDVKYNYPTKYVFLDNFPNLNFLNLGSRMIVWLFWWGESVVG